VCDGGAGINVVLLGPSCAPDLRECGVCVGGGRHVWDRCGMSDQPRDHRKGKGSLVGRGLLSLVSISWMLLSFRVSGAQIHLR